MLLVMDELVSMSAVSAGVNSSSYFGYFYFYE
jgi:hypothetical protein